MSVTTSRDPSERIAELLKANNALRDRAVKAEAEMRMLKHQYSLVAARVLTDPQPAFVVPRTLMEREPSTVQVGVERLRTLHPDAVAKTWSSATYVMLLKELLAYDEHAFDCDEDVNGSDLVDWFAEFRGKVKAALGGDYAAEPAPSPAKPMPTHVSLRIETLRNSIEYADSRYDTIEALKEAVTFLLHHACTQEGK